MKKKKKRGAVRKAAKKKPSKRVRKLSLRTAVIRKMWSKGKKELQKMEALIEKDGYKIKKLNRKQFRKLLEKKEIETGRQLSEMALHVLMAGRCAGSYGCGVVVNDPNPPH